MNAHNPEKATYTSSAPVETHGGAAAANIAELEAIGRQLDDARQRLYKVIALRYFTHWPKDGIGMVICAAQLTGSAQALAGIVRAAIADDLHARLEKEKTQP